MIMPDKNKVLEFSITITKRPNVQGLSIASRCKVAEPGVPTPQDRNKGINYTTIPASVREWFEKLEAEARALEENPAS